MKVRFLLTHILTLSKKPAFAMHQYRIVVHTTLTLATCAGVFFALNAQAQPAGSPLTITNEPAPPVYDQPIGQQNRPNTTSAQNWPQQRRSLAPQNRGDFSDSGQFVPQETTQVSKKVRNLRKNHSEIASTVKEIRKRLGQLRQKTLTRSNKYFANVAALNTSLQTGTTPGNPRLKRRLNAARSNLESLSQVTSDLSALSEDVGNAASRASVLMENVRSAYNISGAVEADHADLTRLEDDVQDLLITIDRTQKKISDNMTRMRAYLGSESGNLRTLSMAVSNGNYYGRSLSYRPFSNVPQTSSAPMVTSSSQARRTQDRQQRETGLRLGRDRQQPETQTARRTTQTRNAYGKRPVMKIRFTKPNVNYEQALYTAISDAQKQFPNASFELVAVYPENGNSARSAIESTRARRNAEEVLRKMREMGLPARNIQLSRQTNKSANTSEVHIYLRNS